MSTDNYQVTVYLPSELLEYVEDYCKYKGILRKKDSKPILATGIIELLKLVAMSPVEELPTTLPDTLPDIDELIDKKLAQKKLVSKMSESAFITKLSDSKVIHTLLNTLLEDEELKTKLQQGLLDNVQKTLLVSGDDKTTYEDENNNTSKEKTFDDTIAIIKTLHSEGKADADIVKVLNNNGYPTFKGSRGKWRSNQVQSILKRHK